MDELFLKEVKNDINKIIYEMKRCKSKSRYYQLSVDLDCLYSMCEFLNISDIPLLENHSYRNSLDQYNKKNVTRVIDDLVSNYQYYLKISSMGTKLINKFYLTRDLKYRYMLETYFSEQDSFLLACDFLKEYNPNVLSSFIDVVKNNRALIGTFAFDNEYGTTFCITETEFPYLLVNSKKNISLPFTYVHESGHIYNLLKYKNSSYKIIDRNNIEGIFLEVYSNFLELVFVDYLNKNNLYSKDVNLIKKEFDLDLAKKLEVFHNMIKEDLQRFDINYYKMLLLNIFGKVIAYHYYDMYLTDPEKTNHDLEQFMINNGSYSNIEVLDMFGLSSEKLVDSKILEKHFSK